MKFAYRNLFAAAAILAAIPAWAADEPGKVTIHRDEWGVPYIFAATDADAAFGLGYAQAEDRLGDIFVNVRTGIGRMSEAFGKSFIDQDYAMRIAKNEDMAKQLWATAPKEVTELGDQFVAGVKQYMKENPDKVPDYALELHGYHVATVGRAMILNWPLGQIQDEMKNTQNSRGFGSNQWAIAPERTADGSAMLLTDPHLTWEGLAVFYEAHVFGDKLEMHGFFMCGVPMVALGHNGKVGWAATTGGPDTADVYEMKINPDNQMQYEYDGEYRTARIEFINIPVKGEKPTMRPAGFTHLGPLFSEPDMERGIAYVGATPYLESNGLTEQFYRMCLAGNTDELYEAMAMNEYMEQNIMFADRSGTIRYVRVGRVPIRTDGYDWTMAVPGNTSDTAWTGIHPIQDLVQIENPAQGYMQNCNISPGVMMKNSPMQPDGYPSYIYNVSWDQQNTRGMRALELLDAHDKVTVDQAKSFAMDVHDVLGEAWQKAVADAVASPAANDVLNDKSRAAAKLIADWDRRWVKDSAACPVMKYLRDFTQRDIDIDALLAMKPLSAEDQQKILAGLNKAVEHIETTYGKLDIVWGDMYKVGRSGQLFAVDGVEFGGGARGSRTLFDVGAQEQEEGSGIYVAKRGSMSMCLMIFREDGVEAYTCIPWGQNADPKSPHHMDQGKKLYAQREFKRAHSTFDELKPHIKSTKVLDSGA